MKIIDITSLTTLADKSQTLMPVQISPRPASVAVERQPDRRLTARWLRVDPVRVGHVLAVEPEPIVATRAAGVKRGVLCACAVGGRARSTQTARCRECAHSDPIHGAVE